MAKMENMEAEFKSLETEVRQLLAQREGKGPSAPEEAKLLQKCAVALHFSRLVMTLAVGGGERKKGLRHDPIVTIRLWMCCVPCSPCKAALFQLRFEGCKAPRAPRAAQVLLTEESADTVFQESKSSDDFETNSSEKRCGANDLAVIQARWDHGPRVSCCPVSRADCNGCSYFSGGCKGRQAAFVKRPGDSGHSACADIAGWISEDGKTCQQLAASSCSETRFLGSSSKEACCKCGGGILTSTPFKYEDHVFTLTENVNLWPKPRTASRYGLTEDCEFALYGLTLDGGTGQVKYIDTSKKPRQPFKVTCKVTAFQTSKITYTADVTVESSELTFRSPVLVFSKHKTSFPMAVPHHAAAKDIKVSCAPQTPWLKFESHRFQLKAGAENGLVDNVKDTYSGQLGTVCQISANTKLQGATEWTKTSKSVVIVKPKAASELRYRSNRLQGSIGQVVPPLLPVDFADGVMTPTKYDMACNKGEFKFDIVHGVGYYDGHPLLELQSNGQLSLNVGPSFSRVFLPKRGNGPDAIFIELKCRIVGLFSDFDFDPIATQMRIVVVDNTCWQKETIKTQGEKSRKANEAECQYSCRREPRCSAYRFHNKDCHFSPLGGTQAHHHSVWTKIPDCDPSSTCVNVKAPKWLHRGTYCPVGYDTDRSGMVYLKEGQSARETLYLRKYKGSAKLIDPPEHHRTYSSIHGGWTPGHGYGRSKLSSPLCWAAKHKRKHEYMTIDLKEVMLVAGVATKGRANHNQWVRHWIVQTGETIAGLKEPAGARGGNKDRNTQVNVFFTNPVRARYVRFVVTDFRDHPSMRAGVWIARENEPGIDEDVAGCLDGDWLIQEKHPDDYSNLKKGIFEFVGPKLGCTTTGVGYSAQPCGQPANITEEDVDIQPMILDDPSTWDGADYWLHPCDCAPKAWGEKPPVDPLVYAQLPPDTPDNFVPSPLVIVEGEFVCSPSSLLGSPLFETDTTSMEAGDCEVKCKNNDECEFFWHGSQHSQSTCRLYKRCDNLLREPGVEGMLMGLPKTTACLVSNPEECWTKTLRRKALTTADQQEPKLSEKDDAGETWHFWYWNLHIQCDYMLLLGGVGVSHCARPTLREIGSHKWKHKRPLPETFAHGSQLKASCWSERYRGITAMSDAALETVTCVNGNWFNSHNLPDWGDFKCHSCVQVGTHGFMDIEKKRQQEMYFFNRMSLQLATEVSPSHSGVVKCLDVQKPEPEEPATLPSALASKAHAWYKSEDASSRWRHEWKSSVGNERIKLGGETGRVYVMTAKGFGARVPVKYLMGNDKSTVEFPNALKGKYTVCSVTRYTSGEAMQRILTGEKTNFLTGQHGGFTGVAHADGGWLTGHTRAYMSTKWVVMCTSPGATYTMVDGLKVGTGKTDQYTDQSLMINKGVHGSKQKSHWAVMELITWDYVLSESEMRTVSQYLLKKMNVGNTGNCRVKLYNPPTKTVGGRISSSPQGGKEDSMLHSSKGWCAKEGSTPKLIFNFKEDTTIVGVILQNGVGIAKNGPGTVYSFQYGYRLPWSRTPRQEWRPLTGLSDGTEDEAVRVYFENPVTVKSLTLNNFKFKGKAPCVRVALLVCNQKLDNEVQLVDSAKCPTTYTSESWSESDPSNRHLRISGRNDCLMPHQLQDPDHMTVVYDQCQPKNVHQMMPASYMGYMFTTILRNAHLNGEALQPGLKAEYFRHMSIEAKDNNCKFPDVKYLQPNKVETIPKLDFWKTTADLGDNFAARFSGFLMIDTAGKHKLRFWADDSAKVFFNGNQIIHLSGCGSTREAESDWMDLERGNYPFEVEFFEATSQATARFEWRTPGSTQWMIIPETAYANKQDATEWTQSSMAKGCTANTALGSVNPGMFLKGGVSIGAEMDCRFVPLLAKEDPIEITTKRSFQDGDKWPEWWEDIETWEMQCPPGRVLQTIDFSKADQKLRLKYVCAVAAGLGQCYPSWTDQQDAREFKDSALSKSVLHRLPIVCPGHDLLAGLHFEYSMGGLWARFKYTCCKESGAPVATVSRGPDYHSMDRYEGSYCPEKVGATGRIDYKQQALKPDTTPAKLTFSEDSGKWCIDGECSAEGDDFEPIGLRIGKLEATAVTDFDGKFEAKGVSPASSKSPLGGSAPQARPPRPPRRPKAPKKPKLEKFEAEMPKYSDKCVGYGDLWKKLQETKLDVTGEEVPETDEVETDEEAAAGFKEAHPCDLAGARSGVRSKWAGGDGKPIPNNMGYNELEGCFDRYGKTSHKIAKQLDLADLVIQKMDVSFTLASTVCGALPDTMAAPFGMGFSFKPGAICDKGTEVGQAALAFGKEVGVHDAIRKMRDASRGKDCSPSQANFARIFCDVHCVRDAVVRGDRTILRNLERATGITNRNMEKLAEWVANTQRADAGWLGDKMDHQTEVMNLANQKQFNELKDMVGGDKKLLFLNIQQQTRKIQSELRGFATGASFSRAATMAANDALDKFAEDGASSLEDANSSKHVFAAFDSLVALKDKLQSASDQREKVDYVAMSAVRMARQMQEQLKLQRQTLGIYRRRSNATREMARQRGAAVASMAAERHAMLLDLDRVWWKIRNVLDDYMEDAGVEIDSYEAGSRALSQYEQCAMDFTSLLSIYKQTMATTDRAHRSLKKAWRHVSNLLGELASHLEDGEAFMTFLQQEGCQSPLAFQTLEQARDATSGMRMLYHRFAVSGLPTPSVELMGSTVSRIKGSWASAQQAICNNKGQLPDWYMQLE
ncbi:Rs1 [Symbiodinium sp. CCMP2456]|nr:Rs1 [Symbiodinium sp. CCMP2456]